MKIKRILSMTFALVMLLGMAAGMSQTAYAEGNTTEITPTKTSGTMTITLTIAAAHSVTVTPGEHMTKTADSGEASQSNLSGAMADVVYTANEGYYFPTDYNVTAVNGISVTRNSYTQITVSGTPTADATIALTAPTAKTTPDAPTTAAAADCTTADNNDGKLTGVTTAMEYKKSDAADWTAGTDRDITGLAPGTYYVRVKATDTTLASDNQELTIKGFISYTVTFKVVNGSWNDEALTGEQTVTLTGHEGDTLKLAENQIPAVGGKAAANYKAGSWDTEPSTETAITAATTYTYSYAAKDGISQTVTFKVVNGSWDDGTADDKTITLIGHEGDILKLTADQIPAVGSKPAANYQAGSWDVTPSTESAIATPTTFTYTYEAVISYITASGDGQEYRIDSNGDLIFTIKRSVNDDLTFANFRSAALDGQTLGTGDYETAQGSLIFTLKAAKAEALSLGTHTLTFTFSDGTATATFTVRPVAGSFEDVATPSKTFTFKKVWEGGSEKSIDFTLYKLGDTVYHHGFDKKIISKTEWQYNAWFSEAVACYVIEEPVEGYKTRYENVGVYAGITDRCCDGGTIVNYKVPKTGDEADLTLWLGCVLAGLTIISIAVYAGKRKKAHSR
ncbi:MAG: hypothetical protein IJ083_05585 [Clostridia bacterium]|nr:hypothetical protein [Clostridia bacterium]